MTCEHLYPLEKALLEAQMPETYRGQPWSKNCREWVYFDCLFTDLPQTIRQYGLDPAIVEIHDHFGTHDGTEYGLVCSVCHDAIMGKHPKAIGSEQSQVRKFP